MSTLPASARCVIVGAGIHGLSTGDASRAAPERRGPHGRRRRRPHRRARQDRRGRRRERHRLRRRAQQLLPARDARADGAFGVGVGARSRGVQLPPRRLHADQPRGDARRRSARSTSSRRRSATSRPSSKAKPIRCSTCAACSTTGRRRGSPRCCTRSAAATRTTRRRCAGCRPRRAQRASRSSSGVTVTGFRADPGSDAIAAVETSAGTIACDELVIARRPWINELWNMLELPRAIDVKGRDGKAARRRAHVALHGAAGRHARRRSRRAEDQRRRACRR